MRRPSWQRQACRCTPEPYIQEGARLNIQTQVVFKATGLEAPSRCMWTEKRTEGRTMWALQGSELWKMRRNKANERKKGQRGSRRTKREWVLA